MMEKLYLFVEKKTEIWMEYWFKEYIQCLEQEKYTVIKGIITNIHPIITKIDKDSIKLMVKNVI